MTDGCHGSRPVPSPPRSLQPPCGGPYLARFLRQISPDAFTSAAAVTAVADREWMDERCPRCPRSMAAVGKPFVGESFADKRASSRLVDASNCFAFNWSQRKCKRPTGSCRENWEVEGRWRRG